MKIGMKKDDDYVAHLEGTILCLRCNHAVVPFDKDEALVRHDGPDVVAANHTHCPECGQVYYELLTGKLGYCGASKEHYLGGR